MSNADTLREQILTRTGAAPAAPASRGEHPVLSLLFLDFKRGMVATTLGMFPLNEDQMAATAKLALGAVEIALASQIRANAERLGVMEFDKKMEAALQAGEFGNRPAARPPEMPADPQVPPPPSPDEEDEGPTRVNVGTFARRVAQANQQQTDPNQTVLPL